MRYLFLSGILLLILGCQKSTSSHRAVCTTLNSMRDQVSVCPEKITIDSRCPPDVECIWQGYAILQCRFTKNQFSTTILLSTINHPVVPIKPDTTLQGYHVELISWGGTADHPQAEIKITAK